MTDTLAREEEGIQLELEEIISGFGCFSISPAPRPPLVVSEKPFDTELNLRSEIRKPNMAFRVGRGRGRRGRLVENAEVMEVVQQM